MWLDLKDQFGQSNKPMLYKIQREICSVLEGSLTVKMYYTSLEKLWDEFRVLELVPVCTCGAERQSVEHGTRSRLIQFLIGLNDKFDSIKD